MSDRTFVRWFGSGVITCGVMAISIAIVHDYKAAKAHLKSHECMIGWANIFEQPSGDSLFVSIENYSTCRTVGKIFACEVGRLQKQGYLIEPQSIARRDCAMTAVFTKGKGHAKRSIPSRH